MNEKEILYEVTENDVLDAEIIQNDNVVSETEFVELEELEKIESTELEKTESVEVTETTEFSDAEVDALNALENDVVAVDYSETLVLVYEELIELNQSLDIIVMVMLAWFGSWVFRSWRTWMVKGGR